MEHNVQSCVEQIQTAVNNLYAKCKKSEEIAMRKDNIIKQLQQTLRKNTKSKHCEGKFKHNELAAGNKSNKENQQSKMNMETAESDQEKEIIIHLEKLKKENKQLTAKLTAYHENMQMMEDEKADILTYCKKVESELEKSKEENRNLKKKIRKKNKRLKQYQLKLDNKNEEQYEDDPDESDGLPTQDEDGDEDGAEDIDSEDLLEEELSDDDPDFDPDESECEDDDNDITI